jgi:hypothetical protein
VEGLQCGWGNSGWGCSVGGVAVGGAAVGGATVGGQQFCIIPWPLLAAIVVYIY